ncbi:MAG TPA: PAS domain S-box protein [Candidatus Binatia bacterium]|nr:PAS domain S-box protein [Candidatus Binatia bacterium]
MESELAEEILNLKDGSHLCLFYEKDPAEQMPALVPYIQDGLRRDEQFIYIADDQTVDDLTERLEQSGINVDRESRRGALNLWTRREWRQPGKLSSENKTLQVSKFIEDAARAGFKGSRFAVDITWALGPDIEAADLEHWEVTVNKLFAAGRRARIACQYNRSRLSSDVLVAAFRTHPVAVLGSHVYPNWFYEAPLVLSEKSSAARIDWMISILERSRIAQKENEELIEKKIALMRTEISKKEIESVLSLMPAAVYRCDENGRITFFNRRAAELWDREPRLHDDDDTFYGSIKLWDAHGTPLPAAETPMARVTATGKPIRNQHVTLERSDGSRIIAKVDVDPLYGPAGDLKGTLNVFDDISESEKAEEASRRLAAIVESSDDAILGKDINGIITSWNQSAERLFGYQVQEIIGKPVTRLIPPDRYDEEAGILERIRQGERVDHYETVRLRKDGSSVPISLTVSPIRDRNNRIVGASSIARDISERKQTEADLRQVRDDLARANEELERRVQHRTMQLERAHSAILREIEEQKKLEEQLRQAQKLEGIGTLAGGIAHDFNNILNIIRAYASAIEQRLAGDNETGRDLKVIDEAISRGASVVRQLLTLARKTDPVLAPTDVNEIISSLANLLKETFPKTIDIVLELGATREILADANQITQGLLNLCVNARDAMPDGGRLVLRTKVVDRAEINNFDAQAPAYVCIEVTDSGTGIDNSIKDRIFDPFFTTKKIGQGTGLGLAMVYGMIKNHKGFINVESRLQHGTTFTLHVPVAPPEQQTPIHEANRQNGVDENSSIGPRTILVVEDEESMLMLLQSALSRRGYNVYLAQDGEEALRLFAAHKDGIDAVLLDIGLPKLDGWDVIQWIKRARPDVSVIITSGYVDPEFKAKLLETGVKDFLDKPYTIEAMVTTLQQVLDRAVHRRNSETGLSGAESSAVTAGVLLQQPDGQVR